jgi:hypothetical protein
MPETVYLLSMPADYINTGRRKPLRNQSGRHPYRPVGKKTRKMAIIWLRVWFGFGPGEGGLDKRLFDPGEVAFFITTTICIRVYSVY